MYKKIAILALAVALTGCSDRQQQQVSVPQDKADASKKTDVAAAPTILAVDEDQVKEIASTDLANAEWTRKACSLDWVGDSAEQLTAKKGQSNKFTGYVIDDADAPAGEFKLVLKSDAGNFAIPAATGVVRQDVADYFKIAAVRNAGFEFTSTLKNVPPGTYKPVFLIQRGTRSLFCEASKALTVEE